MSIKGTDFAALSDKYSTNVRSDALGTTSLWVPLYLLTRCPQRAFTDYHYGLKLVLEWLGPRFSSNRAVYGLLIGPHPLMVNNHMRYTAQMASVSTAVVYYTLTHEVIPKLLEAQL